VVDQRLAVVGDDLAGLDDVVLGPEDLDSFDLEAVEAFQLQLPQMVGRFAPGELETALDTTVGGGDADAEPVGDLPIRGAGGAELERFGVTLGGVDPGGVRPSPSFLAMGWDDCRWALRVGSKGS
jgi:hypothetical protein